MTPYSHFPSYSAVHQPSVASEGLIWLGDGQWICVHNENSLCLDFSLLKKAFTLHQLLKNAFSNAM